VWPERHAQVILRAIQKVNLVANVEPQPKRAPKSFQSYAWVQSEAGIAIRDPVDRSHKSYAVSAGIAEVHKTRLAGRESVKMSLTELELRSEQACERTQPGGCETGSQAVVGGEAVVPCEVVGHLGFDTGVRIHINADATTDTYEIRHIVLIQPEVIGEGPELDMILGLGENHSWYYDQDSQYSK
jgi:hypothetical protein